ncbi:MULTISPECIES: TetR/AcrR family transcriptional regulator [Bacillaceae]|uniref:TetR family transcriptional regulator n=1 Tax=Ornithinibacillus halotolerans TaxID=1274357 RepID=A0A916RXB0_9BACI|nr:MULTISPECIES: TetR/AcrR family transcriptional regulator [Bacillaceae]MBT2218061.1 TetR/AcrR family transcriptional regulator [Virgibacillus dakarensis]MBU5595143.1 TetR/AcrR family transcriptional regulator [Amphibacillus sp. MSJ-3]GGA75227.1 TetR family transcriptional regulator [Ornithinibacillus halotolerans]
MDGFEKRREQKKRDILNAALALFMKYGLQKVSITEIAKKANVSQVTIYNYFESKDNLVRLVFKFYVDQIWDEQKHLLVNDLPFNEKIKKIIFEKGIAANQISERFFQDFMKDYASGQSYVEEIYQKEALPLFIKLFNEGREQGYIDSEISNEAILFYLKMFQEYLQREDVATMTLPIAEDLTKLFFYGIAGKKEV